MRVKHELKYCGRCSTQFLCKVGNVLACQCSSVQLSEKTRQVILKENYDCLCARCLLQLNTIVNNTEISRS